MKILRKIVYPLSVLYGKIISVRNKLYDKGIFKSTDFDIPTIVVGNLSVGGTGKSPQIEYLIRLLQDNYKVAVLSRGYKRQSKGFIIANQNATVEKIGDEPMQFYKKFKNLIVAVDANRVNGINELINQTDKPDVILLDDAFQHRKVNAGLNILLTPYDKLYVDDVMLPTGDLREKVTGANRAQLIVVTKCPENLNEKQQFRVVNKLQPEMNQTIFFSKIAYAEAIQGVKKIEVEKLHEYKVVLVTGIARTKHLCEFLIRKKVNFQHLEYSDHHDFSEKDLAKIQYTFNQIKSDKKLILTTEKDYVRAFDSTYKNIYFLPIETAFLEHQNDFNTLIKNYVEQSSRNS